MIRRLTLDGLFQRDLANWVTELLDMAFFSMLWCGPHS